jgi:A/G-specific adenine glycosylase
MLEGSEVNQFQEIVWEHYRAHQRKNLPWRQNIDDINFGYRVLVSEMMLQQTQVNRVIDKFNQWMELFPTISSLANASFDEVLSAWSGLGYNRRARYLQETAIIMLNEFDGHIPREVSRLVELPGIGQATAAAIIVYAFNLPLVFIETNIRTVFIHHFFPDTTQVSDAQLVSLIDQSMDKENPREWYWALMDYGSFLKQSVGNISKNSKHYKKQSKFEGSARQLRGSVLKLLLIKERTLRDLQESTFFDERLETVLTTLEREKLIKKTGVKYIIYQ